MQSIQSFAHGVIGELVRRQPPSPGRTAFAWQLAVGAALAQATTVELLGTVLVVRPRGNDPRWTDEIERARATVLLRVQYLLGRGAVTGLRFDRRAPLMPSERSRDKR